MGTPNWIIQVSSAATRRKFVVNKRCCRICCFDGLQISHFWWIAVQRKFLKNIFLWMKTTIKKQCLKKQHLNQIQLIRTSKKPESSKKTKRIDRISKMLIQGKAYTPFHEKDQYLRNLVGLQNMMFFLRKRLDGFFFNMASFSLMASSFFLKIPVGISFLNTLQSQDRYI